MTNKKNGFTLIELIVTIAIMSIIGIMVSQLFTSTYKINNFVNDSSNYQAAAQITMQNIQNELKYANSITIDATSPSSITSGRKYIYVAGGNPVKNEGSSLSDAVQITWMNAGFTSSLKFTKSSSKSVGVMVDILKNGVKVYTLDTNININNLISSTVSGAADGLAIEYTLPTSVSSPILVNSISVTSLSDVINVNQGILQMSADISPSNASDKSVVWSVVNGTGIASIDSSGILTAISNGTVTAKATAKDGSGITGTKVITLSNQMAKITSISLTTANTQTTVKKNKTIQIIAKILPSYASDNSITWTVDKPDYATIDSAGLLTSKDTSGMNVTVTATANDGSGKKGTITISIT